MKKYIVLMSLFLFLLRSAAMAEEAVRPVGQENVGNEAEQAEAAYRAGDYKKTIELYEHILTSNSASHKLHYNLGNAYFKTGENTRAILNYERALLLNPGDKDTRYNLQMVQRRMVDRIEELPELFLLRWYKALISCFPADQWACLSVAFFILFLAGAAVFFHSSVVWRKKAGFVTAVSALLLTVLTVIFAARQTARLEARNYAVIMTPSVTVKGAPDNSGTDLFVIHEGLKVEIKEKLGDWYNILLQDGNEGWVKQEDAEII